MKKYMRLPIIIAVLLAAVIAALILLPGTSRTVDNRLTGSWELRDADGSLTETWRFGTDGRLEIVTYKDGQETTRGVYTYLADGSSLTVDYKAYKMVYGYSADYGTDVPTLTLEAYGTAAVYRRSGQ